MYENYSRQHSDILVLGQTTWRKQHRKFGMLQADRLRHLWIIGKTGSGKSTLMASLLAQDLARGRGCAVLDPHGTLVADVLRYVPASRTNEVLLFSPADDQFPVCYNVFRQGRRTARSRSLLASQLLSVFKRQWKPFWGPRLEHVLRNAILAVACSPAATLLLLYRFLIEEAVRDKVLRHVEDPVVRQFWQREFPGYGKRLQAEATAPVLNKLGAFLGNRRVRNLVAQQRSRVDLAHLIRSRGILLANLNSGAIGEDASNLLGGLLLTGVQLGAMEHPEPVPFILYADEFQNFVSESTATMLSESRKFGLGLVLAHQYLGQLSETVRDAVLGNVGSMLCFRLGAQDATYMAQELYPPFRAQDLQTLPQFECVVRVLVSGSGLPPFSARTLRAPAPPARAASRAAIVRSSRQRFCRPVESVEGAIARELSFPA